VRFGLKFEGVAVTFTGSPAMIDVGCALQAAETGMPGAKPHW
jgi:hypothetical protein